MTIATDKAGRHAPTVLIALWVAATLTSQLLRPQPIASLAAITGLVAMVLFGFLHGARRFGWRGVLAFFGIAVLVSNGYEDLSIATGFPFGFFVHGDALGPKLVYVPLLLGPGYFAVCYIAWSVAGAIFGSTAEPPSRLSTLSVPIIAAFVVVGFDLCQDPLGATVAHDFTYAHAGGYFGVPLSNFLGWFLATWTIFQLFALFLLSSPEKIRPVEQAYWLQATGFWVAMALQFPLLLFTLPRVTIQDSTGWLWRSGDIAQTATIMSIYTMLAAAVTATLLVLQRPDHDSHDLGPTELKNGAN